MKKHSSNKAFSLLELAIVMVIIGLLAVGITMGQRMINKGKLSRARMLTNSAPVAGISGLRLWLEPTLEESFTEDNDGVITWNDLSPYGIDQVRVDSLHGPSLQKNVINGLPAINTSSYYMKIGDNKFTPMFEYITVFFVIKTADIIPTVQGYIFNSNYAESNPISSSLDMAARNNGTDFFVEVGNNYSITGIIASSYYQRDTAFIMTLTTGLGTYAKLYINGELAGTSILASYEGNHGSFGKYFLLGGKPTGLFQGYIGEVIVYDNILPIEEIQEVEKYLSKKYGIELGS